MANDSKKSIPLSHDAMQLIRGVIIGKLVTLVVMGGLLWLWLKPRLQVAQNTPSPTVSVTNTSNNRAMSTFQDVTDVPSGYFNYGGSTSWAPIRQLVDSQIQLTRPEFQLQYVNPADSSPGNGSGIRMLLDGKLDFAQSSRPLTAAERNIARQRGFTLEQRQVGIDAIAVVVNPALKVTGLTVEQLQQIYLGKITNWKQVGGPDLAITPFSQHPENADLLLVSGKEVLDKQILGSNVQYVYSTTEALRRVNQTPGGLYYGSARGVVYQCMVKPLRLGITSAQLVPPYQEPLVPSNQCPQNRNQLNTEVIKNGSYPITTRLFVIIKQNQRQEQQAGEAYARLLETDQGQRVIKQVGFVAETSENSVASSSQGK
ncbi:PstS family phosphate ABC transporter substrate-binding protein [Halotia branconii]|uniref:Substrate-binding domain-containing protein n=1 Tax=Halotia branconii CENA392 TaxID=1539056 RepID=A0AAJ6P8S8_9CYAN|nr:substrate-binding domain-containing protein [Halotia branconii]WGV25094.1 substrate-binding domain-containing protein [Halotia branconii CENA392]